MFNACLISRSMALRAPPSRPAPPPLPSDLQREFEALQRQAEVTANERVEQVERHPDAPLPLKAEFIGDINPVTGERGGPKREPVQRWVEEEGDWSFKGRVSDFWMTAVGNGPNVLGPHRMCLLLDSPSALKAQRAQGHVVYNNLIDLRLAEPITLCGLLHLVVISVRESS